MLKKQLFLFFSVLAFVSSLMPFIMGAKILTYPMLQEPYFPFGNLLAAIGFMSYPSIFYFGIASFYYPVLKIERIYSLLFKGLIFISALWIPLGYYLSGNWSNTFSGSAIGFRGGQTAMELFWWFNYALFLLPFGLLILFLLLKLIPTKQNSSNELMHPDEVSYILKGLSSGILSFKIAPGYYWDGPKTVSFEFICRGHIINIFVDIDELDYVDRVTAPDGRYGGFDNWIVREDYTEPLEQLTDKEIKNLISRFEEKQTT